MADVTVQVIAPGSLSTWGQNSWGADSWGLIPGLDTEQGSVTVEAQLERGWGGQTWGENNWGDLSNEVAIVSGISASLTLGPLEFAGATTGWGRQEWGALGWGIGGTLLADGVELTSSVGSIASVTGTANITPTGIELAATAVSPSIRTDVSFSVTGIEATITGGEESIGIGVPVTGLSLTTSIDSVQTFSSNGWGRGEWGSFAWGVPYSVEPAGQELTTTIGNAVGFTDFNQDITGQQLTSTLGNFSLKIDQDIFVNASEDQIDASVGSVTNTGDANVSVTGISSSTNIGQVVPENKTAVDVSMDAITMTLGDFTLIQGTTESPTGQELTISQGEADGVSIAEASGSEATLSINSVSISISNTPDITGISMTASIGEAVAKSWQEVDPGVNNTWSDIDPGVNNSWGDVDLAA